jgi:hypothetical protein
MARKIMVQHHKITVLKFYGACTFSHRRLARSVW